MPFSDIFINKSHIIEKRTFKVSGEDWQLIAKVFPEAGFRTYFPGFAVRSLCEILREHQINNINARFRHPRISTVGPLLTNLDSSWKETFRDE